MTPTLSPLARLTGMIVGDIDRAGIDRAGGTFLAAEIGGLCRESPFDDRDQAVDERRQTLWGARKLTPASPSLVRCGAGALIATLTMLIVWAGAMAN